MSSKQVPMLDSRTIPEAMREDNEEYENSVFDGSLGHFWGLNGRYYVAPDGTVEESDGESPPQIGAVPQFVAKELIRLAGERDRIRAELIDWLVGTILPCDPGLINGRRIVDEIDRICPEE